VSRSEPEPKEDTQKKSDVLEVFIVSLLASAPALQNVELAWGSGYCSQNDIKQGKCKYIPPPHPHPPTPTSTLLTTPHTTLSSHSTLPHSPHHSSLHQGKCKRPQPKLTAAFANVHCPHLRQLSLRNIELQLSVFQGFEAPLLKTLTMHSCESPALEVSTKLGVMLRDEVQITSKGWERSYKQPW
jgi:hypothetical protein